MVPSPPPVEGDGFAAAWQLAHQVPGWLTHAQARLLFDQASALPLGSTVLEIGSHQGRSTIILAAAAQARDSRVIAVDPFVDGRLFGGLATRAKFERNLESAGLADQVDQVVDYSTRARPDWNAPIDLLYIDGKHDYWTVSDDLRWREFLPEGAAVLVHDCFSSIGVTLGILHRVLPASDLRYLRRAGSLALFEVGHPSASDRVRVVRELPWWVRNVAIKVLLRLRLRPVARLVGHDSPYDPY
jgi:hypothetical protein